MHIGVSDRVVIDIGLKAENPAETTNLIFPVNLPAQIQKEDYLWYRLLFLFSFLNFCNCNLIHFENNIIFIELFQIAAVFNDLNDF